MSENVLPPVHRRVKMRYSSSDGEIHDTRQKAERHEARTIIEDIIKKHSVGRDFDQAESLVDHLILHADGLFSAIYVLASPKTVNSHMDMND